MVATTRAGEKPTPRIPRSPSETTWKRTLDLSIPGCSFSSSRRAAHFASPTVSPSLSTRSSAVISSPSAFLLLPLHAADLLRLLTLGLGRRRRPVSRRRLGGFRRCPRGALGLHRFDLLPKP